MDVENLSLKPSQAHDKGELYRAPLWCNGEEEEGGGGEKQLINTWNILWSSGNAGNLNGEKNANSTNVTVTPTTQGENGGMIATKMEKSIIPSHLEVDQNKWQGFTARIAFQ